MLGEDNRQTVIFHQGVQEFKVFVRQETSAKTCFGRPVLALGSLVQHRVNDCMITCYCLIVMGIITVIN